MSNKKNINIKHGMNEKTSNKTSGLVDYKELENNILSSIREWQSLINRSKFRKKINENGIVEKFKIQIQTHLKIET